MLGDVVSNDAATLSESYLECERIATESSSSFLRAFRTLPKEKHDGIKALYAFCRRADDVADGDWLPDFSNFSPQQMGSLRLRALQKSKYLDDKHESRGTLDHETHIARLCALIYLRDNIQPLTNCSFPKEKFFLAFWHTIEKFNIPSQHLHSLIDGMEDDLYPYSLFMISRFREEIAKGESTEAAIATMMDTAGRAVMFSGATVAVGLCSLFYFEATHMPSMGMGAFLAVAAAMI